MNPRKYWTEADVIFLKNNYWSKENNWIAMRLQRTPNSVALKASRLFLEKDPRLISKQQTAKYRASREFFFDLNDVPTRLVQSET
jgi:hypothetical protein